MKMSQGKNAEAIHNSKGCLWNTINDLVLNSMFERKMFLVEASTRDHLLSIITAKLSMDKESNITLSESDFTL